MDNNINDKTSRTDFRDQYVVSIDPKGCKDIDDALYIEKVKSLYFMT